MTRSYAALLFDMDGTLLTSLEAAERVWSAWATRHGLDPAAVLTTMHGVRAEETVRRHLPGADVTAEAAAICAAELIDTDGVREIVGAAGVLAALPPDRWAIVTSAQRELALVRLAAAGLPEPNVMVCAEDVERGKPEPDGYLLAAERLGVAATECLVLEDAPAGIEAARRAGAAVLVVGSAELPDYAAIGVTVDGGRISLG